MDLLSLLVFNKLKNSQGTQPTGTLNITANGDYNVTNYAQASVAVAEPTGTINITENGDYNVTNYAQASVAVPEPTGTINIVNNGDYNVKDYAQATVAVPTPSGTINITTNGNYDVTSYAQASVAIDTIEMNYFVQTTQPETFNGIWIQTTSLSLPIIEVQDINSRVPSYVNIIRGNKRETVMFDSDVVGGLKYPFYKVVITDSQNTIDVVTPIYYGNGTTWVDITPKTYTQLTYIQGTGTQYIITGVTPDATTNTEVIFKNPSNESWENIFGIQAADKLYEFRGSYRVGLNGTSANVTISGASTNFVKFKLNGNGEYYVNDTLAGNLNTSYTSAVNLIELFHGYNQYGYYQLQECKMWKGGELIRDFIPVITVLDVICLYDKVNGVYYTNDGRGEFIGGEEI